MRKSCVSKTRRISYVTLRNVTDRVSRNATRSYKMRSYAAFHFSDTRRLARVVVVVPIGASAVHKVNAERAQNALERY